MKYVAFLFDRSWYIFLSFIFGDLFNAPDPLPPALYAGPLS
jgi:hypothetical protein